MAKLEGMEMKFAVTKVADLSHLSPKEISEFGKLLSKVENERKAEGKKENTYIVVNTDEPYADEVIDILKHHGQWG